MTTSSPTPGRDGASWLDQTSRREVRESIQAAIARRRAHTVDHAKHFDRGEARAALMELKSAFDRRGKRFFLDRGTLLGAVREGDFISSDYDIDVGVFADEVDSDELRRLVAPTSFTANQDSPLKVGLVSRDGIQVDIFLTRRADDGFFSSGYRGVHEWYFSPFELAEFQFLGSTFLVPANYEKHLEENYGNWRNATAFYDLSFDEPCVEHARTAAAVEYLARRMSDAVLAGSRDAAQRSAVVLRDRFGLDYTDWFPRGSVADDRSLEGARHSESAIVIIDDFDQYTHRLRRAVESALGLGHAVDLCFVRGDSDTESENRVRNGDRRLVAESIDRIREVISISHVGGVDFDRLLDRSPLGIVVSPTASEHIDSATVERFESSGCRIVAFGGQSLAVTVDQDGLISVRDA